MKEKVKSKAAASSPLQKKVAALKKAVTKAFAAYEKQFKLCEEASHKKLEKHELFGLNAALKIAKFQYKIKKTELKVAKVAVKHAEKEQKKNTPAPEKPEAKAKKAASPVPKDKKGSSGTPAKAKKNGVTQ